MDYDTITYYILDENMKIVPVKDVLEWAEWFETGKRIVKYDSINNKSVSTIFVGIKGPYFETAILGPDEIYNKKRSYSIEEALITHERECQMLRNEIN